MNIESFSSDEQSEPEKSFDDLAAELKIQIDEAKKDRRIEDWKNLSKQLDRLLLDKKKEQLKDMSAEEIQEYLKDGRKNLERSLFGRK